ncbi:tyrosine-protein kinase family protein [Clostridium manihotivorum]|uniref:non-specific protein-tyrosine kinase n=1 Tax=Clostridium manihotivorum TaxID=2320868 RepID=A0A410E082_9CLOT|nr:CpsD/CapB family tyrosine-protein kinase [Clostridium manihotivorum]QAA34742.1 capsular biosynthesis protein [Clostridium manihotivorum]
MALKSKNKHVKLTKLDTEAFSALRANIQYSYLNNSIKSIVVTSSNSGEGKSTVACNLATSFSQSNKKVLLLDCDFRNPSIHKHFNLTNTIGLSDILLGKYKLQDCVQECEPRHLYVLTSGNTPNNPSQLLSSNIMLDLISELKENFDLIILDTPPILRFADSQILSAINDGTIIVSKYGKTNKQSIIKCKEIVDKVNGRIIGSIINDVPKKVSSTYYKNYDKIKAF